MTLHCNIWPEIASWFPELITVDTPVFNVGTTLFAVRTSIIGNTEGEAHFENASTFEEFQERNPNFRPSLKAHFKLIGSTHVFDAIIETNYFPNVSCVFVRTANCSRCLPDRTLQDKILRMVAPQLYAQTKICHG